MQESDPDAHARTRYEADGRFLAELRDFPREVKRGDWRQRIEGLVSRFRSAVASNMIGTRAMDSNGDNPAVSLSANSKRLVCTI